MSEYIITDEKLRWLMRQDIGRKNEYGMPETKFWKFVSAIEEGEEIVRCRDCKYFDASEPQGCTMFDFAAPDQADGFCAWGELE